MDRAGWHVFCANKTRGDNLPSEIKMQRQMWGKVCARGCAPRTACLPPPLELQKKNCCRTFFMQMGKTTCKSQQSLGEREKSESPLQSLCCCARSRRAACEDVSRSFWLHPDHTPFFCCCFFFWPLPTRKTVSPRDDCNSAFNHKIAGANLEIIKRKKGKKKKQQRRWSWTKAGSACDNKLIQSKSSGVRLMARYSFCFVDKGLGNARMTKRFKGIAQDSSASSGPELRR